jgi:hypothetical protein
MTRNEGQIESQFNMQVMRHIKDIASLNEIAESNVYDQPFSIGLTSLALDYISQSILEGNENLETVNKAVDFVNSNQYGIK